jgi:GDP/UDP-N,N'-diacetylbacillosamine 2-epimerase (hydrolysing)
LIGSTSNVYNVGSLSLDNLQTIDFLSPLEFYNKFGIDITKPTILVSIHPETNNPEKNHQYSIEIIKALEILKVNQILITLPNSDTLGSVFRDQLIKFSASSVGSIFCIENLGTRGFFSAMKYCLFLLGNSSSGIIEAASLNKWVINLGSRQCGRYQNTNVINVCFQSDMIIQTANEILQRAAYTGGNIYYQPNVSKSIISFLKTF